MRAMRILYCIPNLRQGGAERQLSYLAAELAQMGHEVHVASSRGGSNLERLRASGAEWHRVGGSNNRDPLIFFRLVGLIRRLRPDVVQTILTPMDIMGGAAALLTRTRWVLKESSSAPLYVARCRNRLRLALGRRADAVVSNSAGGDAYWREAGVRARHVIPNAVPFEEIVGVDSGRGAEPRPASGEKIVLFAGRMDAGKNVEALVAALAKIAGEVPFVAVLCGDGPRRTDLERMVGWLGLGHRLFFPGYVSNLWHLMKRADAFVSLSRFEGCPNVVLEAAACGSPLIVSDIPAHRELLDGHGALFVDPDDPAEAAEALKATLTYDTAAHERAQVARAKVNGMSVETTARVYERLYLNLCGKT
jgi:glycosyltransferase involved in cell wall biosynthesis